MADSNSERPTGDSTDDTMREKVWPERWANSASIDDQTAAKMLQQPEVLPNEVKSRILAKLQAEPAKRNVSRWFAAPALAFSALALFLIVHQRGRAPVEQMVNIATGVIEKRSPGNGVELTLTGPAQAKYSEHSLVLEEGEVEIRTTTTAFAVRLPTLVLDLRPSSSLKISLRSGHFEVAAFAGSAAIHWSDGRQSEIAAGSPALSNAPPALSPTPAAHLAVDAPTVAPPTAPVNAPPAAAKASAHIRATSSHPASAPSKLAAESVLVSAALKQLSTPAQAGSALKLLNQYDAQFPHGTLRQEAFVGRARALLILHRNAELLRLLDRSSLQELPSKVEMLTMRGELRAKVHRLREAQQDFVAVLLNVKTGKFAERALYGSATCYRALSDDERSRQTLDEYLRRFPNGTFSSQARRSLGR